MTFATFKLEFFKLVLGRNWRAQTEDPAKFAEAVDRYFCNTPQQEVRARLIEATFKFTERHRPSDAYMLLALALEKGVLAAIVTTNFDTMLERAERLLGLSVLNVFAKGIATPDDTELRSAQHGRTPYLKLHGCLAGRSITHITEEELKRGRYPKAHRDFLCAHFATADVIVTGYSGYDGALAKVLGRAIGKSRSRVYWCSPNPPASDAPLVRALGLDRIIHVESTFDSVVEAIAWPVLEKPSHTNAKPVFIRRLLDWRVDRANRDYEAGHAWRNGLDIRALLAHRQEVETSLDTFLASDKPMAVVAGPSGVGKSALALRLIAKFAGSSSTRILAVPAGTVGPLGDFTTLLADRIIGGLGGAGPFSFAEFELWLRENRIRLVVYLDALNEYAVDLDKVAGLLRDVVRFCYFLPKYSPIRVIVTVRQETWNRLHNREDRVRLSGVCWNSTNTANAVHAIQLGPLTDTELQEALGLLCETLARPNIYADLSPQVVERLRDPFLLASVADEILSRKAFDALNWVHGPTWQIYAKLFEAKLVRNGLDRHQDDLLHILAQAAVVTLERNEDRFRLVDIVPKGIGSSLTNATPAGEAIPEVVHSLIDLGLLARTDGGFLRFVHERTQEYFLAKALELRILKIPLVTSDQLDTALRTFDQRHQFMAALRIYFLLSSEDRFPVVMKVAFGHQPLANRTAETRLVAFAKELMVDLAADDPTAFRAWFRRIADDVAAREGQSDAIVSRNNSVEHLWRSMIQAAAHLPDAMALEVLTEASRIGWTLPRTEANIYATDKIVRLLLHHPQGNDLLRGPLFGPYYSDPSVSRLRRLGRVLGLMGQIGPDNTHPDEYTAIYASAAAATTAIFQLEPLRHEELKWFADFIYAERDRYVFNGDLEGMKRFFKNANRSVFIDILDNLEQGSVLRLSDIDVIKKYTEDIYFDFEFQFGNLLFIISAANDFSATIRLWETCFDGFDDMTPANTIDFFQATITYIYVVNGREYDGLMARHIDRVLRQCPQVIEYEPGRERGARRGFSDEFDKVFEDGFSPIATYATLIPSPRRRTVTWLNDREHPSSGMADLPVFDSHLKEALERGELRKALRIIHALGQFAILWPREGLETLALPFQYDHPTIHRATIRVLAEVYNRYPMETHRFLANSGLSLPPGDMRDMRARIDPHTGRRQFEGLQWARVLHFLLSFPGARQKLILALRILYGAPSLDEAIHEIAAGFGWLK